MPDEEKKNEAQETECLEIVCKCPGFPDVIIRKTKADQRMMIDLGVKKLEDGTVIPDESKTVDLDKLTQTYKDQCGMEAAKRLLQTGERTPEDFKDPGMQYDDTIIPQSAQERANAAVAAKAQADQVKAKFGISPDQNMTEEQFENLVKSYIAANPDKFVAQQPKTEESK